MKKVIFKQYDRTVKKDGPPMNWEKSLNADSSSEKAGSWSVWTEQDREVGQAKLISEKQPPASQLIKLHEIPKGFKHQNL